MKAKLIKTQEGYILEDTNKNPIGQTFGKFQGKRLSLKNCQAIERGYDLDELFEKYCTHEPRNSQEIREVRLIKIAFNDGFQKALSILGDKKFSEGDMAIMMLKSAEWVNDSGEINAEKLLNECIQSLQQTEWDVSFNPDEKDSEGCLILKRL